HFYRVDRRKRRRACPDVVDKLSDRFAVSFDVDEDTCGVVQHSTSQRTALRARKDERAKADSLNDSPHEYSHPGRHRSQLPLGGRRDMRRTKLLIVRRVLLHMLGQQLRRGNFAVSNDTALEELDRFDDQLITGFNLHVDRSTSHADIRRSFKHARRLALLASETRWSLGDVENRALGDRSLRGELERKAKAVRYDHQQSS